MSRYGVILESLSMGREFEKDPKKYFDYIVNNFGEDLIYGDSSSNLYDMGIKHVKKLSKILKKNYKDVLSDIMTISVK